MDKNTPSVISYDEMATGYQNALSIVDDVVLKNYISTLNKMEVIPLSDTLLENNIKNNVLLFKINEMVYEKEEFAAYKFASIYNSLATTDSAVILVMDSDGSKTDFYMGVRSLDSDRTTSSLRNTLENSLKGQFPGVKTHDLMEDEMDELLNSIKSNSISSVSCVANNRVDSIDNNENFIQGLEKFVLSMQGEKYTGVIIANGTNQNQLNLLRKNYEQIYTQLSSLATIQVNYSNNFSENKGASITDGYNSSVTYTKSKSETEGNSYTQGANHTEGTSQENSTGKTFKGVATAAGLVSIALAPVTGGASLGVGFVASNAINMASSVVSKNKSISDSITNSETKSSSKTKGESHSEQEGSNHSETITNGVTSGTSESMTLTMHDKSVEKVLERIDKQLQRIDEFESLGMYECAAYFLSDDQYAAEIAASTYKSLMRGEHSGVEIAAINSWGKYEKDKTDLIGQYVKNFIHPVFLYEGNSGKIEVTPCSLISGNELAIHMGLPRKSVCGLPVIEHVDFGKEVVKYNSYGEENYNTLNLGKVFNMGSESKNIVKLDIESLSMHTFITGSTGSGKSNTVYEFIRQLELKGKNFLIIEPAKGEYKHVFGSYSNVYVFGTNPNYTPLLKINPFSFPKGVHVLEHVDRLIEIFNVCWPMYAAMPAVLKEAVLRSYESCGWNLCDSTNDVSEDIFPNFKDLLLELTTVIKLSEYSDEVKSNYIGSLATRISSLTNGLNGKIFTSNEIKPEVLFDKNVIVDLSRIGSLETKSLIMGLLIVKLSEYRMSEVYGLNQPLKHITVLEEAHNILKNSAGSTNPEGADISRKSVEMISNAIAEMRTYGEGFVIVDQSPEAVDISAIRNTNTKIIMRLPDADDRKLAGKAAGLKDHQLDEIAKLPKGVAVVYQNDWVEPLLCKINKSSIEEEYYRCKAVLNSNDVASISDIVENIFNKLNNVSLTKNLSEIVDSINRLDISSQAKLSAIKGLNKYCKCNVSDISPLIYEVFMNDKIRKQTEEVETIQEWRDTIIDGNSNAVIHLNEQDQNMVVECILKYQIDNLGKPNEYLDLWKQFLDLEVV